MTNIHAASFFDIHSHHTGASAGHVVIQSLSITADIFLAMPKTKPISIGLHPWYAQLSQLNTQMAYLDVLAKQNNVKLIGECGLDTLRGEAIENQIVILEKQILLAEKLQKPVILHCVKAFDVLIEIKKRLKITVPLIIHGFNKNEKLGLALVKQGFLLSFGEAILNPKSGAAALLAQLDFFFLETDDGLTPIKEIYHAAANIKKCTRDELKALIFAHWKKLKLI